MANINLIERLDYVTPVQLPTIFVLMGTMSNINITVEHMSGSNSFFITVVSAGNAIFPIVSTTIDPSTGLEIPVYGTSGTILIYANANLLSTITISVSDIDSLTPEVNVATKIQTQFSVTGWNMLQSNNVLTLAYLIPYDPTIEIIPLDSTYIAPDAASQDALTQLTIRSQPDYVTVDDPFPLLHSTMQNEFYQSFTTALLSELQNIIDNSNPLKTLFYIDYYDGDQSSFLEKISNLASMFAFNIPQSFLARTNVENGDVVDLNKQNDFLRNIVKRMWLSRRWAGTLIGYKLPLKWIVRIGAVHLAMLYVNTQNITTTTGKIYRLLDETQLGALVPNIEGTAYPNSGNLVGAESFADVNAIFYRWDTGNTWDQSVVVTLSLSAGNTGITFSSISYNQISDPKTAVFSVLSVFNAVPGVIIIAGTQITVTASDLANGTLGVAARIAASDVIGWIITDLSSTLTFSYAQNPSLLWDSNVPFVTSGRSLMIEIALDRLLLHTNSIGTKVSLMDTLFHEAIQTLVGSVQRAQDIVSIGSQMTLITGKDGTYNSLAYNAVSNPNPIYTHANIEAKFQVFKYLPDKQTLAWSGGAAVSYLKIGTGGYGNPTVNNSVFVDRLMSPSDPSRMILTDLEQPIFKTVIGINERDQYGPYYLLNTVVHPRTINGALNITTTMNGVTATSLFFQNSLISLVNDFVTVGSVTMGIEIIYNVAVLTVNSAINITLAPPVAVGTSQWTLTVVAVNGTSGSVNIQGQTVIFGAADMKTTTTAAAKIAAVQTFGDYTASYSGNIVTFIAKMASLNQRIFIYESYNSLKNTYDAVYKYQEIGADGMTYQDFIDTAVLAGYTTDGSYAGLNSNYFPTSQRNAVTLAPLFFEDQYPRLFMGLVGKYTMDESTPSVIFDHSFNYTSQSLYLNNATTANTTLMAAVLAPGTIGPQASALAYNGSTSYLSIPPSTSLNNMGAWTYSLFFQSTASVAGTSFLFSKTNPTGTVGYSAYFTNINLVDLITAGAWSDTGSWSDGAAWTDTGSSAYGSATLNIAANIIISPAVTNTTESWSVVISIDANWHQLTVGFDWVHLPEIFLDGIPVALTGSITAVGTGVTQTDDSISPVVFGSGIGGLSGTSIGVLDTNGIWQDTGNWTDSGSWNDASSSFIGILDNTGAWTDAGFWQDGGNWSEISSASSFQGNLAEFRIYNRLLSATDATNLYISIPQRLNPLLSSTGNQQYVFIDHLTGYVMVKPQYNINGPLASLVQSSLTYSGLLTTATESYRVGVSNAIVAISEIGLFDSSDHLVAYGTFPPVIYNPALFHLAFNILIPT